MKKIIYIAVLLFAVISAHAQKLPNVQQKPLRAPAGVKIDGKANEWDGLMQASNSATELTYAISNDDENLYLVYQIANPNVAFKLMMNGLSIRIQKNGKKDVTNAVSVTYPIFERGKNVFFSWGAKRDEKDSTRRLDSLATIYNGYFSAASKWIGVNGIPGVDSLLSVYNSDGIRAAGRVTGNKVFTAEVAINLKHLQLDNGKFAYQIMINGLGLKAKPVTVVQYYKENKSPGDLAARETQLKGMYAPTDFWGEYTLAKP